MPYIEVKTNKHVSEEKAHRIANAMGRLISILPGKTEKWLMTEVKGDCFMTFAGSDAPCVLVNVSLFGKAPEEAYEKLTAAICEELRWTLDIVEEKMYVKYEEVSHWGWNKTNF